MIRRGIALSERESVWLLISQVEHARISGELTQNSKEHFSPEVVQAITHHDDGWAEWETAPKLNPEIGGPYSFLEMPLAESLVIWDASIAAARKFGPLAGFIVAGHFYNLLSDSENAQQPAGIAWLAAKRKSRTVWLDEWVRENPSHTIEGAKRAQHTLLTADLFSLWLCCDAPIAGDDTGLLRTIPHARASTAITGTSTVFIGWLWTTPRDAGKPDGSAGLGDCRGAISVPNVTPFAFHHGSFGAGSTLHNLVRINGRQPADRAPLALGSTRRPVRRARTHDLVKHRKIVIILGLSREFVGGEVSRSHSAITPFPIHEAS
jgi:hypothetical protein